MTDSFFHRPPPLYHPRYECDPDVHLRGQKVISPNPGYPSQERDGSDGVHIYQSEEARNRSAKTESQYQTKTYHYLVRQYQGYVPH